MIKSIAPILFLACLAGASVPAAEPTSQKPMNYSVTIQHLIVESHRDFAATIREFEKQIGVFDPAAVEPLTHPNPPVEEVRAKVQAMVGSSGFMRIGNVQNFGGLFPLVGQPVRNVRQYVVGNPLFAIQMLEHQAGVGLYVPLRVLIREADGRTYFEYDLPSSQLGQFQDAKVTEVAQMLDEKLKALIASAAGL